MSTVLTFPFPFWRTTQFQLGTWPALSNGLDGDPFIITLECIPRALGRSFHHVRCNRPGDVQACNYFNIRKGRLGIVRLTYLWSTFGSGIRRGRHSTREFVERTTTGVTKNRIKLPINHTCASAFQILIRFSKLSSDPRPAFSRNKNIEFSCHTPMACELAWWHSSSVIIECSTDRAQSRRYRTMFFRLIYIVLVP